jgi:hypothetical protein
MRFSSFCSHYPPQRCTRDSSRVIGKNQMKLK